MDDRELDPFATRPGTSGIAIQHSNDGLAYAERMRHLKQSTTPNNLNQPTPPNNNNTTNSQQQQQENNLLKEYRARQRQRQRQQEENNYQSPPMQPQPDLSTSSSFRLSPPPNATAPYNPHNPHNPHPTSVDTINVSGQGLSSLDDIVLGNQVARSLHASSNALLRLRPFPSSWTHHLEILDLSENRLVVLKEHSFQHLHALTTLNLSNNSLSTLPTLFHSRTKLKAFNVSKNNLSTINLQDLGFDTTALEELNVSENSLTHVPHVVGCTSLYSLNVRMNLIASLPITFLSNDACSLKIFKADVNAFNALQGTWWWWICTTECTVRLIFCSCVSTCFSVSTCSFCLPQISFLD